MEFDKELKKWFLTDEIVLAFSVYLKMRKQDFELLNIAEDSKLWYWDQESEQQVEIEYEVGVSADHPRYLKPFLVDYRQPFENVAVIPKGWFQMADGTFTKIV